MKKLGLVLSVMVVFAGIAVASSLSVPWFVDNADPGAGWPPSARTTTIVFLKSNVDEVLTCEIAYFSEDGLALGPAYPNNVFTIEPKSALGFRPVAVDPIGTLPGGTAGGQEGSQGVAVPDRPRDVDTKKNGSISISWVGGPNDIQGMVATTSLTMSYGHLLPPGN